MSTVFHRLVAAIEPFRPAVRVKWSGSPEPTDWEPWVIVSSRSYLETGTLGPVPFREVEWVEISLVLRAVRGQLRATNDVEWPDAVLKSLSVSNIAYRMVEGNAHVSIDFREIEPRSPSMQ
jgi:hypothetical protein